LLSVNREKRALLVVIPSVNPEHSHLRSWRPE
jgi:hypothetical protein